MRFAQAAIPGTVSFLLSTTSAFAGTGNAPIPEPNTIVLLTMASAGVLIGRRMSSRKPPED